MLSEYAMENIHLHPPKKLNDQMAIIRTIVPLDPANLEHISRNSD